MRVLVGTCGWSAKGGRKNYFKYFEVVEVQETFYRLPKEETVIRWRREAPENFRFILKAWQGITHPSSSPTWRKSNIKPVPGSEDKYGFFRPTEEVFKSWRFVKGIAEVLKANLVIFQTPPSFGYSREHLSNIEAFFSSIERGKLMLGWEPRGDWHEHPEELRALLERLDLIHVVDPLRRDPLRVTDVMYFRLHGLGGREVNYKYKYTDDDLTKLRNRVKSFLDEAREVYVMFNNVYMFEDALRFKKVLEE
ncbi:MAG: DUF72 domain-containing protein [Thermoprotei archaeon]|nr:MAG: DUF72 domain-containing protein [Thermoprotei archaeon]